MIGWVDCSAGVSGDMLLGALVDVGVPLDVLQPAVDAVLPDAVRLRAEPVERAGLAALQVHVPTTDRTAHRAWRDVRALLERADLPPGVQQTALAAFTALAEAEAGVHRVAPDDVHFHEVGAVDAIADVVGVVAGLAHLQLERLTVSTIAVGSGTTRGAHGPLPVPAPAVLALLSGLAVEAGPAAHEATTPTGAALVRACADGQGALPPMVLDRVGVGAGGRDRTETANVVRLVLGQPLPTPTTAGDEAVVVEANVDDLDPRIWPGVLQALLGAGAHDAWLTPVLAKKGRPAHVLSVLCPAAAADGVRRLMLTETTTIGLRTTGVHRTVLHRQEAVVDVDGQPIRVKVARLDDTVVNAMPEWDDVAAAARTLRRPAKTVLLAAHAAAQRAVASGDGAPTSSRSPSGSGR